MTPHRSTGTQALRRGRVSTPGQIYLVSWTTRSRNPIFLDPILASAAARILSAPVSLGDAMLLAWVLMPDHAHALLQLGERESLSTVVGRMKARSSFAAKRISHRQIHVWHPGFQDRAIRREEDLIAAARYLVANPVRAGLVARCRDYPYWDAVWI